MKIALDYFRLTLDGPKRKERLELMSPLHYYQDIGRFMLSQFGLMHLIAPHFPKVIETDFLVNEYTKGIIEAMYCHHGRQIPVFEDQDSQLVPPPIAKDYEVFPNGRAVVAFSAGKDSLNNLRRAREKFGPDYVFAVHVRGLNRGVAAEEERYAQLQAEKLGFLLGVVDLKNGAMHKGGDIMRSRDIFLTAMIVPHALAFGAREIITEGFYGDVRGEPFSGVPQGMYYLNNALRKLGLPVQVRWHDQPEMEIVKDLFQGWPEAIQHIHNCFSPGYRKGGCRRAWLKRAPSIGRQLLPSQCGSCVKCLTITLGRMLYDPEFRLTDEDRLTFFAYLTDWISKHPTDRDIFTINNRQAF